MPPSHGHYNLESDGRHPYHTYAPFPLQSIDALKMDDEFSFQLAKAHRLLGKLDGMLCYVPDINILAYPLRRYEAKFSYDIEKEEALYNERFGAAPLKTSVDRITFAYTDALLCGAEDLSKEETLFDSLRSVHHQMFSGDYDDAGQYRVMQLFTYPRVFAHGGEPFYNPPNPSDMITAMANLENYINDPCKLDGLIQVALAYYQLVTIRPFSVGNGLLERMYVNFLLVKTGLLSLPLLCLSESLLASDAEFRDALRLIRSYGRGFDVWITFFVKVLISASEKTLIMLDELYRLRLSDLKRLHSCEKLSPLVRTLYEHLWRSPTIETSKMVSTLNMSYNTVAKAMGTLRDLNILEQVDSKTRYRQFGYHGLLDICGERQVALNS